jgi:hypothetical protein
MFQEWSRLNDFYREIKVFSSGYLDIRMLVGCGFSMLSVLQLIIDLNCVFRAGFNGFRGVLKSNQCLIQFQKHKLVISILNRMRSVGFTTPR